MIGTGSARKSQRWWAVLTTGCSNQEDTIGQEYAGPRIHELRLTVVEPMLHFRAARTAQLNKLYSLLGGLGSPRASRLRRITVPCHSSESSGEVIRASSNLSGSRFSFIQPHFFSRRKNCGVLNCRKRGLV